MLMEKKNQLLQDILNGVGIAIAEVKIIQYGITQFILDNGCILCQTSDGHIWMQGKKSERVAEILAKVVPLDCLRAKEAKKYRTELFNIAKCQLLGKDYEMEV